MLKRVSFDIQSLVLDVCKYGDDNGLPLLRGVSDPGLFKSIRTGTGCTPLHVACSYNQVEVVEFLLKEQSVPVNGMDNDGWTPLHAATMEKFEDVVRLLLKCQVRGASPIDSEAIIAVQDGPIIMDPLNDDGDAPEDLAEQEGAINISLLLRGRQFLTLF